jgi:hypothetical protein
MTVFGVALILFSFTRTASGAGVTTPETLHAPPVTNLEDYAFNNHPLLTDVTIAASPASLTPSDIRDRREDIAQQTKQYIALHFPNGKMPPKHDFSKIQPASKGQPKVSDYQANIMNEPPPGGVGYGLFYESTALLWTNFTIADYYIIAPTVLGQPVSFLYLTSTCRAQLGTESLVAYDDTSGPQFWIYDWSQPSNPWQVLIDLPTNNPQYLTTRPDELAIPRQMVHVRNATYNTGFVGGLYQWENQTMLFNFNRGGWDFIYSHNYTTASLTNNLYVNTSYYGSWGPIVETFNSYTNINPVGFDLIHLFQDGNVNWLTPSNCVAVGNQPESGISTSTNWQLLAVAPYTSFAAAISSNNLVSSQQTDFGTLYVTANTNAASFGLNTNDGLASSGWVMDLSSNSWDMTVVGLPPAGYTINFYPVPGLDTPTPQAFAIAANSITMIQGTYQTASPPTITTTSPLPAGTVGNAYSTTIAATNGTTPYSWSIISGGLPDGLNLGNGTGVVSGTPTTDGTSNFTVQVTDANSLTASQAFTLTINPTAFQAWQIQYFGSTTNPLAAANMDADGTGQNNQFKFVTGLDPTNPASVAVLSIANVTNWPAQNTLLFHPLASGRTYTPQFSTDLTSGVWLPLTTYTGPATNNGIQVSITDTNPIPPEEFYRLDISLP